MFKLGRQWQPFKPHLDVTWSRPWHSAVDFRDFVPAFSADCYANDGLSKPANTIPCSRDLLSPNALGLERDGDSPQTCKTKATRISPRKFMDHL